MVRLAQPEAGRVLGTGGGLERASIEGSDGFIAATVIPESQQWQRHAPTTGPTPGMGND